MKKLLAITVLTGLGLGCGYDNRSVCERAREIAVDVIIECCHDREDCYYCQYVNEHDPDELMTYICLAEHGCDDVCEECLDDERACRDHWSSVVEDKCE